MKVLSTLPLVVLLAAACGSPTSPTVPDLQPTVAPTSAPTAAPGATAGPVEVFIESDRPGRCGVNHRLQQEDHLDFTFCTSSPSNHVNASVHVVSTLYPWDSYWLGIGDYPNGCHTRRLRFLFAQLMFDKIAVNVTDGPASATAHCDIVNQ